MGSLEIGSQRQVHHTSPTMETTCHNKNGSVPESPMGAVGLAVDYCNEEGVLKVSTLSGSNLKLVGARVVLEFEG